MDTRRKFISKSLLAVGAAGLSANSLLAAESNEARSKKISIEPNDIILFQGDSITDAGRQRDNLQANNLDAFGKGYALIAGSTLLNTHADKNIKVYNRGISGHRVPDLIQRWDKDTLDLRPTILSILIGVNDFWRTVDSGSQNTAAQYKQQYQQLLDNTLKQLPNVKLIIGEPFGVKNVQNVTDEWFPDFLGYQQAAKEIADEYQAIFLPYQSIFDKALKQADGAYWTADGVHPSMAGANLMAESWLNLVK